MRARGVGEGARREGLGEGLGVDRKPARRAGSTPELAPAWKFGGLQRERVSSISAMRAVARFSATAISAGAFF